MQYAARADERREFQRLHLPDVLSATFNSLSVSVSEIGILGARIRHEQPVEATRGDLRLTWNGAPIVMRCEVVRSLPEESALRFLAALEDSGDRLREMLAALVRKALDERYENSATRLKIRHAVDGDKTIRGADANFISYRLEDGAWKRRHVFLPEQPAMGFTVARGEDAEEMRRLCEVYEASDDEGRRLIRLFAELSVSSALKIPPAK